MAVKAEQLCESVTLYQADCLDVLPTLGRVDAVVTDPPYAIPTQVAQCRTVTRNVGDMSIVECAFTVHARAWKGLLRESGRVFVFCDGSSYPVFYRACYGRFNLASLVWDKGQIGMGREFRKRHELIVHGWGSETPVVDSCGVGYSDVLTCPPIRSDNRFHPAEKPVDLIRQLLRVCGAIILDPFAGSGTTALAAMAEGRSCILVESNPEYCDIIRRRVAEANGVGPGSLFKSTHAPQLFAEPTP